MAPLPPEVLLFISFFGGVASTRREWMTPPLFAAHTPAISELCKQIGGLSFDINPDMFFCHSGLHHRGEPELIKAKACQQLGGKKGGQFVDLCGLLRMCIVPQSSSVIRDGLWRKRNGQPWPSCSVLCVGKY